MEVTSSGPASAPQPANTLLARAWQSLQMPLIATLAGLLLTTVLILSIGRIRSDVYAALLRGALSAACSASPRHCGGQRHSFLPALP